MSTTDYSGSTVVPVEEVFSYECEQCNSVYTDGSGSLRGLKIFSRGKDLRAYGLNKA